MVPLRKDSVSSKYNLIGVVNTRRSLILHYDSDLYAGICAHGRCCPRERISIPGAHGFGETAQQPIDGDTYLATDQRYVLP